MIIRLYSTSGKLIRVLDLGYRSAGMHMSRDKAAYWDGKNDNGETVSSGVYIYSMQAAGFTSVKKMVILQ